MYATSNNGEPIKIFLEHPTRAGRAIGRTTLLNQAFAASSSQRRRWQTDNGETHHIVGDVTANTLYVKVKTAIDTDASRPPCSNLRPLSKQSSRNKKPGSGQVFFARLVASQSTAIWTLITNLDFQLREQQIA